MRSARLRLGKEVNGISEDLPLWEANLPSLETPIGANANAIICFKVCYDVLILFSEVSERDQVMTSKVYSRSIYTLGLLFSNFAVHHCHLESLQRSIFQVPDLKSEPLGKGPRKMHSDYITQNSDLYLLGTIVVGQEVLSDSIFHLKLRSYMLSKSLESRIWCIQ